MTIRTRSIILVGAALTGILLAGCDAGSGKRSYESTMVKILEDARKQLEKAGVPRVGSSEEDSSKDAEIAKILEDMEGKVDRVAPPDDFFSGHSDIKEFLSLGADFRTMRAGSKDKKDKSADEEADEFIVGNSARQALDRARRALPFLDYELTSAFSNVVRPTRGALRPGPGSPRLLP